jgi:hypothetical protein
MEVSDQTVLGTGSSGTYSIVNWVGPTGGLDSAVRVASTRLFIPQLFYDKN